MYKNKGKLFILISCVLVLSQLAQYAMEVSQISRLEGAFNWALKHFIEKKTHLAEKKLELLLTFIDTDIPDSNKLSPQDRQRMTLLGKIWLLMGATKEKLGKIEEAKSFYQKVQGLSTLFYSYGAEEISIDGLDLYRLPIGHKVALQTGGR